MNHFFALELSEEARQTVHAIADEWRHQLIPASWYDPADYHITLKFLGNVEEAEKTHLKEAAEPIAAVMSPFLVSAQPGGAFPSSDHPSVLWAGVANNPELDILRLRLDRAMTGLGFRADHRLYRPHVTIARCDPKTTSTKGHLSREHLFATFVISRFVLMQTLPAESRAKDLKARYNIVHTFPFGRQPEG